MDESTVRDYFANTRRWGVLELNSLVDVQRWAFAAPASRIGYRGQPNAEWKLQSTLDRYLGINDDRPQDAGSYAHLITKEKNLIQSFIHQAPKYLNTIEKMYLNDRPNQIVICRHYGVPTRVIDWTTSPYVSLYFACHKICKHNKGSVHWYSCDDYTNYLNPKWAQWGIERLGNGEAAWTSKVFQEQPYENIFVVEVHYKPRFARLEKQRGFLTACSSIGMCFNDWEPFCNGTIRCGKTIIADHLKDEVIDWLAGIGITSHSLDYPGADILGSELATKPEH